MNILTKIVLSVIFTACMLSMGNILLAEKPGKTVYFYYAENCTACKEAHNFYKKPLGQKDGISWTDKGINFVAYRIVDENNKIISKNMDRLTGMCGSITKKTGNSNFVYYRRDVYEYYKNKNLPYFRKEEKYSRKDEPFPTPIFVIGNRVVLGFNQELIQKAIDSAK
jgi:hypothetical protein